MKGWEREKIGKKGPGFGIGEESPYRLGAYREQEGLNSDRPERKEKDGAGWI